MTKMKIKKSTAKNNKTVASKSNKKSMTPGALNNRYVKVSTGIYKVSKKYIIRKSINGSRMYASFTSLTKAKAYYKSL